MYLQEHKRRTILAIHVDDGLHIGRDLEKVDKLLENLKKGFEVTINKNTKTYLGIEMNRTKDGLHLSQGMYTKQVLERFNMSNCRVFPTPIVPEGKDVKENKRKRPLSYREAIGCLQQISCKTRPDIAFSVNFESRAQDKPEYEDFQNVKRTLSYLNGTRKEGIKYYASNTEDIYCILASCYIRFTLNICSFVHQCNTFTFLFYINRRHVSASHGHLQVL
jgi:hypothetical protein